MRKILFFLLMMAVVSCAPTSSKDKINTKKNADYYYKIGLSYLSSGNNSQAIYYLTKSYEINPDNPEVLNALGIAYSSVGEFKKAEKFFLRAIELAPEKGEVYTNIGIILAEEKKYNKAIWYLKKAIQNPNYKNKEKAFYNLALIYKKMGDDEKYEEHLKKALSYNPYFVNAYISLGNYYLSKKDYRNALDVFTKGYNIGIYIPEIYMGLGKSYYFLGKLPKAKYYFLKAKKFAKDNVFISGEADRFIKKINEEIAKQKEEELKRKQAELEKLEKVKQLEEITDEATLEEGTTTVVPVKKAEKVVKKEDKIPKLEKPVLKKNLKEEKKEIKNIIKFYVQVGVFSKKIYAEQTVKKLKEQNFKPLLIKKNMDGKPYYFVIIGYFNSYLEASKFYRKKLKPKGFRGIVKFEREKG